MNNEKPLDLARALGRSIQFSTEYKGLQSAHIHLLEDDHASSLLEKQRNLKRSSINHMDSVEHYKIKLERLEREIATNKVIQEYYQWQRLYTKLLNNINGIIDHYIEDFTLSNQGCQCNKKCGK